jgi:hypothetical protein
MLLIMGVVVSLVTIQQVYGPGTDAAEPAALVVFADEAGTEVQIPIDDFGGIVDALYSSVSDEEEPEPEPEPEPERPARRMTVRPSVLAEE